MTDETAMKTTSAAVPTAGRPAACPGTTRAGRPCGATPTRDGYCPNHSPAYTDADRSIWGKRGNLASLRKRTVKEIQTAVARAPEPPPIAALVPDPDAPDFATASAVRQYLEKMARRVQGNQLAPSQAGAIAQLAGLALKLVELQNERDLIDLELRRADEDAQDRPSVRFER